MTGRRYIVWLARSAIVAVSVTLAFVGCSRQGEGERCDRQAAGDEDCDTGLRCIRCTDLAKGTIDRCCPPGASSGDCERADPARQPIDCAEVQATGCTGGTSGTSGTGGRSGSAGSGGSGNASGAGGSGNASGSGGSSGGSAGASGTGAESGAPDAAGAGGV